MFYALLHMTPSFWFDPLFWKLSVLQSFG